MTNESTGAESDFSEIGRKIIRVVEASPLPLVADAIARSLSLAPAAIRQPLALLTDLGLIRLDSGKSVYYIGKHLFDSARSFDEDFDLLRDAADGMAELSDIAGEMVVLASINGDKAVYVARANGRHGLSAREIGTHIPLWQSAIGKVLAANLQTGALQSWARRIDAAELASTGFPNFAAFTAHLDLIRACGFWVEMNGPGDGISAVAAPIVDSRGHAIAAIGLEEHGSRLSREKLYELAPAVIEATRKASARAGGAPRPLSNSPKPSGRVSPKVKMLAEVRNLIGESPIYDAANDRLFWVDMYDPTIFRLDRKSGELRSFPQSEMVTALALAPEGLFAAAQSGLWLAEPETGERVRNLGHPEANIPANRYNDGKCDSRNRLWLNTVDFNFTRGAGALYRRDAGGEFRTMDTGLNIPNGMGWSPDNNTMYLADSADRVIYAYDLDEASGDIANRRVLVRFPKDVSGAPDGLTVDRDGKLWVAIFDGWRVSSFSAEGALIGEIMMPVPRPTSCTFGGKNGDILFVTSARIRVSGEMLKVAPHSGAVFEIAL